MKTTITDQSESGRDHLANERTFLAWVRTGAAIVVFGFAIGRFCDRDAAVDGACRGIRCGRRDFGLAGILHDCAGCCWWCAGLVRYRKTRAQLDAGTFEPAGFVLDLITIVTVMFGLALAGYLIYAEKSLG